MYLQLVLKLSQLANYWQNNGYKNIIIFLELDESKLLYPGWKAKAIKKTCLNRSVPIQQNIDLKCQTKEI
jgi:hypothetical protein